jgi:hypothetical protein
MVEHLPDDGLDVIPLSNTNNGVVDLWMKLIDTIGHGRLG